jgi:hypothetical protein
MGRTVIRIRGKAQETLFELSRRAKVSPSQIVEKWLMQEYNAITDDAPFQKRFFACSIVFQLELPFCFPYDFEEFELQTHDIRARVYLERVPKRNIIDRLPFRSKATAILELAPDDVEFAKRNERNVTTDKLRDKYFVTAYNMVKCIIIGFRRITNDYYNIGVIQPPMNSEEFEQKVHMFIVLESEEYSSSRFMPVKEGSYISIGEKLDEKLRSEIMVFTLGRLEGKKTDFLTDSYEYLDAAEVFKYQEQWNLCLVDSVIAMESGMASLVFGSTLTKHYLEEASSSYEVLKRTYKEKAPGLPKKLETLFPMADRLNLQNIILDLRKLMPFISNEKTEDGIYDLRSKIVHEGISIGKEEAEQSIKISSQFLKILRAINESCK